MFLGRTSQLAADRWGLDLDAWREELLRASLVPPAELHRLGTKVGDRLRTGKAVRITHSNGTDLSFRLGKFPIQLDDALVDASDVRAGNNMASIPGGVVGTCIDHTTVEGEAIGNHTTYPMTGPVTGHRWGFSDGHLKTQTYESGGEPIQAAYAKASRNGRDRLGFISVGLNSEITKLPMMEDQELGAIYLQLGGNNFRGGKITAPTGAWMILKGADLTIDGKPLLEGGRISE
jgi:aminopeptidase